MSTSIMLIAIITLLVFCAIGVLIKHPWFIDEYPKEVEDEENLEIKKKFDEYKKSQE